jgi:hypothetical protein
MPNVNDWRGKPIRIGSRVVYPSRQQGNLWMTEGEVVFISQDGKKIGVRRIRSTTKTHTKRDRVSYPNLDRLTLVDDP